MFNQTFKNWCITGLDEFLRKDQGCDYVLHRSGRPCILKYATHGVAHKDWQNVSEEGEFQSPWRIGFEPVKQIHHKFVGHLTTLCEEGHSGQQLPKLETASTYRRGVLAKFKQSWQALQSNKTCLACLQAFPDHILPCGHSFCDHCVREFGEASEYFEHAWTMSSRALCQASFHGNGSLLHLHPTCAGVRMLTLDGGGVRGIVELVLLERLSSTLGLDIPMQECFDLIIGTSTGKRTLSNAWSRIELKISRQAGSSLWVWQPHLIRLII